MKSHFTEEQLTPLEKKVRTDFENMQASVQEMYSLIESIYLKVPELEQHPYLFFQAEKIVKETLNLNP